MQLQFSAPIIVLDTNVVLDWLLFADPSCAGIRDCVTTGKIQWIATAAMRKELSHVLERGGLAAWAPDATGLFRQWDKNCRELPLPPSAAHVHGCLCSDVDDQKFIDLALAYGADWLVSRDRAILNLTQRMRAYKVEVLKPQAWSLVTE